MKFIYSYQLLVRLSGRGTCRKKDHEALPLCLLLRLPPKKWSLVSVLSSFSLLRLLSISIRDCQQITFVTLNRFCLLYYVKQTPPPSLDPLFLTEYQGGYRIATKIKWKNTPPFYIAFQVLKVLKFVRWATRYFISCYFILVFTSADIIFNKFLELHLTLS